METSWSRARSTESSLPATPAAGRRFSSAGVTSTIPIRDFAKPLSHGKERCTEDWAGALADSALDLAVTEQELNGSQIACSPVDKGHFGPSEGMRAKEGRLQPDLRNPRSEEHTSELQS